MDVSTYDVDTSAKNVANTEKILYNTRIVL
jgi:hypothetical protein